MLERITIVETLPFARDVLHNISAAGRDALLDYLSCYPDAGEIIPGSGGVRKLRWARAGMGKRGGARVIYFYHSMAMPLFLLGIYAKSAQENLKPAETAVLKSLVKQLIKEYLGDMQ